MMEYTVKVILKKDEISDKEKAERIKQFQEAFVTAAVSYYSNQKKQKTYADLYLTNYKI